MKRRIQIAMLFLTLVIGCGFGMSAAVTASAGTVNTTTSTQTKVTKKTAKLKAKAKKTKTVKKTQTTKKAPVTTLYSDRKVVKNVTVKTTTTTKYKKNQKKYTIQTKAVTTTVKTTTTYDASQTKVNTTNTVGIDSLYGKMDEDILEAFQTLGFKIVMNANNSTSGNFNPQTRIITMKVADVDILLHEMGHFTAFLATTFPQYEAADDTSEFAAIYEAEKDKYTDSNKAYVTRTVHEYFAESFQDYCNAPATLKAQRPRTYEYMDKVVKSINSSTASNLQNWYSFLWD